ncbi:SEC-C domain-containing protein [Bacillaceae bacterium IKA-2]|nr:SEC-C domain-containing protein [Bacillaceae bacterium IKA-2]
MKIVGKNERCSCGSGKKYKHCCANKNPAGITQHIDAELIELKQNILQFAVTNYQEDIDAYIDELLEDVFIEEDKTFDQVATLLMVWIIFWLPIVNNEQTILQTYIKKQDKKIKRSALIDALHSWDGVAPSIYKVVKDHNDVVDVEDIFTLEKQQINMFGLKEVLSPGKSLENCYVIGTVIEYRNRLLFFTVFQIIEDTTKIENILSFFEFHADVFTPKEFTGELFPDIIEIIYDEPIMAPFDIDEIEWDNQQQEQVIELYKENLKLPEEMQTMIESVATTLWKTYCLKTGGNIRSIPKYTAALHYIVGYFYLFFGEDKLSKDEVCNLYGVKLRTLSETIKKLDDVLEDDVDSMLEELMFDFDDDLFLDEDEDEDEDVLLFEEVGLEETDSDEVTDLFQGLDDDIWKKSKKTSVSEPIVDELAKKREEKRRKKSNN